jgi:hypothetical protein
MLGTTIQQFKAKFHYTTIENVQLEKVKDMIDHGNFKYALELLQTIKPTLWDKEFDIIELQIKQRIK